MRTLLSWLLCLTLIIAGCASTPLPARTLVLAQVAHVASKDDAAHGVTVDDTSLVVPPYLLNRCALDAGAIESGDLAVLRVHGIWWRDGHVSSSLWWVVVPKGMVISPEDFVEVELKDGVGDERCPLIARVRSPAGASGECGFDRSERVGAGALMESFLDAMHTPGAPGRNGPPTSVSIYCNGLEAEGWAKHPAGPYGAVVWRKPAIVR